MPAPVRNSVCRFFTSRSGGNPFVLPVLRLPPLVAGARGPVNGAAGTPNDGVGRRCGRAEPAPAQTRKRALDPNDLPLRPRGRRGAVVRGSSLAGTGRSNQPRAT